MIIKWFKNSYYSKITNSEEGYKANLLQAQDIIEMYLKEHTKSQPKAIDNNVWDEELINKFFYYLKYDKGIDTLEDSFMNDFKQHYSLIKK